MRALVVLGLAVLAGVIAVVLAARWMTQRGGETTQLVVASRDVPLGSLLDSTMITSIAWPGNVLPVGAFSDPKETEGRVVKSAITRGEPLLEAKLAPKGARGGLSAVIGPGMRAISVRVNEVVGVAGFALPGSFVDVMVHTKVDDPRFGKNGEISKIVLERILVLAVAQEAGRDDTKPKVVSAVTLEVTPEQAEQLDLARSVGNLSLVLRNQLDKESARTAGSGKSDLFAANPAAAAVPAPAKVMAKPAAVRKPVVAAAVQPPAAAPPPEPKQAPKPAPKIEIIRGVQRSEVEL